MKKLLLLIVTVAMALSVSAAKTHSLSKPGKAPARVDIITEQPEGEVVTYKRGGAFLVVSLYGYDATTQTGQTKVCYAPDGKTVYIQDPLAYGEGVGAWVHGELSDDGTTITVPLGQYVSYNEEYDYGLVLAWGATSLLDLGDDFYWLDFTPQEGVDAVTYAVDAAQGTIALQGSEGDLDAEYPNNLNALGLAGVWSDDGTIATLEWNTVWTELGEAVPAVPANPEALEFFDCGDESGYTRFDFNINLKDQEGNSLNSDYVTYSIFTDDDKLFTFDAATYGAGNGFDTDMTEIPYGYSGEDFYLRRVYFYRTNKGDNPFFTRRIGIQVYYTVDGVRNASDIVYIDVYPFSGIDGVQQGKTVTSQRYYNLAGQQVTEPAGVAIQVTTYSDGTTRTTKVVK
ncbi:MAG: hypothetical protein IJ160_07490 [Muribaculaceae bacterium]|nr:hypothetical protein [Muribaculaceae bacterium]